MCRLYDSERCKAELEVFRGGGRIPAVSPSTTLCVDTERRHTDDDLPILKALVQRTDSFFE